jgi:UDP-N-acetylmuramoyl-L-alanyl-D-glutamate--2,6-diaminopimelate ligase
MLRFIKGFIPRGLFKLIQPKYHWVLAWVSAIIFFFPSKNLIVIGVTGTNGKSTVVHMLTEILKKDGKRVASISSLRIVVGEIEKQNIYKMTMPGRFFIQRFLRSAVRVGCTHVIIEVTSEGIKQYRHLGIKFDIALLTNITPEHIEAHGSFEAYRNAKSELFYKAPVHIINEEDSSYDYFSKIPAKKLIKYKQDTIPGSIHMKLLADFNKQNASAAYVVAKEIGISDEIIKSAIEGIVNVPGRLEFVYNKDFSVVVDYAHTPDALRKVYEAVSPKEGRLICVLGAVGGGRDKWKRKEFGKLAAEFCDGIIITNEDPYDEDPKSIMDEVREGVKEKNIFLQQRNESFADADTMPDRREAIRNALDRAQQGDVVVITGKGAEPWIMGPNGTKISWDDRQVVREELEKLK